MMCHVHVSRLSKNNLLTLGFCVEPHQQDEGPQLATWHYVDSYDLVRGHISKRTL